MGKPFMKPFLLSLFLALLLSSTANAQTTQRFTVAGSFTDNNGSGSDAETEVRLYRCAGVGCVPTVKVQTLPANSAVFVDTIDNDVGGVSYTFGLTAYNSAGESPMTTATIVSPKIITIPNAPSGILLTVTGVEIK